MAFLNWTDQSQIGIQTQMGESVLKLRLSLTSDHHSRWVAVCEAIFESQSEVETRIDLPEQWTLFVKLTPGDSKLLVAHPETGQFVGTLALSAVHAGAWLKALREGQSPLLSELGRVNRISNFDFCLELSG